MGAQQGIYLYHRNRPMEWVPLEISGPALLEKLVEGGGYYVERTYCWDPERLSWAVYEQEPEGGSR